MSEDKSGKVGITGYDELVSYFEVADVNESRERLTVQEVKLWWSALSVSLRVYVRERRHSLELDTDDVRGRRRGRRRRGRTSLICRSSSRCYSQ